MRPTFALDRTKFRTESPRRSNGGRRTVQYWRDSVRLTQLTPRFFGSLLSMALAITGLTAVSPAAAAAQVSAAQPSGGPSAVLVFHDADDGAGVAAIERLGREHDFAVDDATDAGAFTAANLARYRAVVILSAAELDSGQEAAFRAYIEGGGGFLGVHDAARAQPDSAWFTGLVGSRPGTSPDQPQRAVVEVGDRVHPATRGLPLEWTRTDVWLNWSPNPSGNVHT